MTKLLSVCVAAYNVEATLPEALDPFLSCPGRERLDVMIVDDGSTDRTGDVARSYVARAPEVFRLISKKNGGWGSTLNAGFAQAAGTYFKQLDGDDAFSPETLGAFLDFLAGTDADVVYTPYEVFDHRTGRTLELRGQCPELPPGETVPLDALGELVPEMHGMSVRAALLREGGVSITEGCFYTDAEFVLKSYNLCQTAVYYDKPVYRYRVGREGQSMSASGIRRHYKDNETVLFGLLEHRRTQVRRDSVRALYRRRLGEVCSTQYAFYLALPPSRRVWRELRAFDARVRSEAPELRRADSGAIINLLKRLNCRGYYILGALKRRRDRKKAAGTA